VVRGPAIVAFLPTNPSRRSRRGAGRYGGGVHAGPPVEPPDDPEAWTDEQWLSWLATLDDDDPAHEVHAPRLARWRDRPSTHVLGAAMLGLRDAIYGRPNEEVIVVRDASGDPPDGDEPVVHLDPEYPERSEVVVRRHRHKEPGA
jgi:hypothetical protein